MTSRKPWTHDELMLAMNLYFKLPFDQLHHGNPLTIVARKIGRKPSSLSIKLCNLASLYSIPPDTRHQKFTRSEPNRSGVALSWIYVQDADCSGGGWS